VSSAGYSGTPLARKLGFKDGMRVVYVNAPEGFEVDGIDDPQARLAKATDLVVCFVIARRSAESLRSSSRRAVTKHTTWWVCFAWRERTSSMPSTAKPAGEFTYTTRIPSLKPSLRARGVPE
jgi:hypothetical protein